MSKNISRIIETARIAVWRIRGSWCAKSRIAEYLSQSETKGVNLGCGSNLLEGWLNCDVIPRSGVIYVDCSGPLSFPNASFDYVYSEHMIEHLELHEIVKFLGECRRILKPNGTLRLVTPDLDFFASLLKDEKSETASEYLGWLKTRMKSSLPVNAGRAINAIFFDHEHQYVMNETSLSELLRQAGFKNIQRGQVQKSPHEFLRKIERHGRTIGEKINQMESLVVEAGQS